MHTFFIADVARAWVHTGIHYAEPPLGDLRFAPPVAMDSLGVATFNATMFGAPCVQPDVRDVRPDGSSRILRFC